MTDSNGSDGRGTGGRFTRGNRYGRGNPNLVRLARAQAEVRAAAKPGRVRALLDKLHALGLAGDVQAARAWLDRVLGRSEPVPMVDVAGIDFGELQTAEQVVDALVRTVRAAVAGEVSLDVAERIGALVAKVGEAGAWRDVEARVAEIERERGR